MKKKIFMVMIPAILLATSVFVIGVKAENNPTSEDPVIISERETISDAAAIERQRLKNMPVSGPNEEVIEEVEVVEDEPVPESSVVESTPVETPETNSEPIIEEVVNSVGFTVEDVNATMYATGSVNVRTGADKSYEKLGTLSVNQQVKVTGKASTGWYQIEYDGAVGYVSNNYLSETKLATSSSSSSSSYTSVSGCLIPVKKDGNVDGSYVIAAQKRLAKIPRNLQEAYVSDGWSFYVTDKNIGDYFLGGKYGSCKGTTRPKEKAIYVEDRDSAMDCIIHEFGHYVDTRNGGFKTDAGEFALVYDHEYAAFCENFETPSIGGKRELFGEGFEKYVLCPGKLQGYTPELYQFIKNVVDNI